MPIRKVKLNQMITVTVAASDDDLRQILALQRINLPVHLSPAEIASQGFVTVLHDLEDLRKMNQIEPHTIALDGEKLIAYVLAMTEASQADIPVLVPMFELFRRLSFHGRLISAYHYMVVGQVCVAKAYRGKGVLDQCYAAYRRFHSPRYDFAITQIAAKNLRSIQGHLRIGFEDIHHYQAPDGEDWVIMLWDWRAGT